MIGLKRRGCRGVKDPGPSVHGHWSWVDAGPSAASANTGDWSLAWHIYLQNGSPNAV
jgi:hypothetical protein